MKKFLIFIALLSAITTEMNASNIEILVSTNLEKSDMNFVYNIFSNRSKTAKRETSIKLIDILNNNTIGKINIPKYGLKKEYQKKWIPTVKDIKTFLINSRETKGLKDSQLNFDEYIKYLSNEKTERRSIILLGSLISRSLLSNQKEEEYTSLIPTKSLLDDTIVKVKNFGKRLQGANIYWYYTDKNFPVKVLYQWKQFWGEFIKKAGGNLIAITNNKTEFIDELDSLKTKSYDLINSNESFININQKKEIIAKAIPIKYQVISKPIKKLSKPIIVSKVIKEKEKVLLATKPIKKSNSEKSPIFDSVATKYAGIELELKIIPHAWDQTKYCSVQVPKEVYASIFAGNCRDGIISITSKISKDSNVGTISFEGYLSKNGFYKTGIFTSKRKSYFLNKNKSKSLLNLFFLHVCVYSDAWLFDLKTDKKNTELFDIESNKSYIVRRALFLLDKKSISHSDYHQIVSFVEKASNDIINYKL